jgi:3-oxoacyl-[acyl-carrier-protein] synthase III
MPAVVAVSTGSFLPGEPIDNSEMERLVGPLPPDVLEGIQVEQRYWLVDTQTGEHRWNNSDMAVAALESALDAAEMTADELELLVLSTASPDFLLPPLVTFVQERLGLERCATIEIRSGCAGAVEAMDVAGLYLERGLFATAAVVGSEAISPLLVPVFLGKDPDSIRMRDRMNPYNFGDGAGAVILRADDAAEGQGIIGSAFASVGGTRRAGMQIVGAGTHAPIHEQLKRKLLVDLQVDVVESGRFTPHVLTEALREVLAHTGVSAEEIDVCIIPEGNAGYMVEELRAAGLLTPEWIALEDKIIENLAFVGATGSAAVPLALDDAWRSGKVKPGDRVMLLAIETSKWKYAGMVLDWTAPLPAHAETEAAARHASS